MTMVVKNWSEMGRVLPKMLTRAGRERVSRTMELLPSKRRNKVASTP